MTSRHPDAPAVEPLEPRVLLSGTTYVVDSLLDTVESDGQLTLREAILAANADAPVADAPAGAAADIITFAPSLFIDGPRTIRLAGAELPIVADLTVVGPGRDLLAIDAVWMSRVLSIVGGHVSLQGLKITRGYLIDTPGAGIWIDDAAVNFLDVTIDWCMSRYGGGGIYARDGQLSLTNCLIQYNSASRSSFYDDDEFPRPWTLATLAGASTSSGQPLALPAFERLAGGLYLLNTSAVLDHATLDGNGADSGGGLYALGSAAVTSHVFLSHCTISVNSASGDKGRGGGLFLDANSQASLVACDISGNYVQGRGSGLKIIHAQASLADCTIQDNHALSLDNGGAIDAADSAVTLTGCQILHHFDRDQSGLSLIRCTATISRSLFALNGVAGVSAGASDLTIVDSEFHRNSQGGLGLFGCTAVVTRCSIHNNSATGVRVNHRDVTVEGQPQVFLPSLVTMIDCDIADNRSNAEGGGLSIWYDSTVSMLGCTVRGNYGRNSGGGLSIPFGQAILTGCTIADNYVEYGNWGQGGGVLVSNIGRATLIDCQILNNRTMDDTPGGGGIAVIHDAQASLTNCRIVGNIAHGGFGLGGGVYFAASNPLTMTGCLIAGNLSTGTGGAMAVFGQAVLTHCTVTANRVDVDPRYLGSNNPYAGGIYVGRGSTVDLRNTILAGNLAATNPDIEGPYRQQASLIGGDPGFMRQPSPGADGLWDTPDDDPGDLHLALSSPCIGAGLSALALTPDGRPLKTDLDGRPRILGPGVDLGAFEYAGSPGDLNLDGLVNVQDINPFV
ncbi:MAG: right-handed parallel beta-helix repeat-containing protein, partial [Phycisphaeraceae bacterium]|nr:right-handed parallel beta-helix repeat-containing protein [Phycisphaeraceae bacterium]